MARPPEAGQPRDVYLRVRLAPREDQHVEALRAGQSRSDYVRRLIEQDAHRNGLT